MYKRRRCNKFGGSGSPRCRPSSEAQHNDIAGTTITKFRKKLYRLLPAHEAKVEVEIAKVLNSMKLKAIHNNLSPRRTGGIPLTDNTLTSYEKHYDSLYFFFSHIQDFDSLLMLRREPLEYFPSMNPKSIVLHHVWKTSKKGTPLMDEHGNSVKDLDGKDILCNGTWCSPENLDQCRSAISTLHKARNMIGAYEKPCQECIELDKKHQYYGCRFHRGSAKLWSSGNPNKAPEVYNWSKAYCKEKSSYRARGDSPITPDELHLIRSRLMMSNTLWDFQLYTIILLSCRLFLREDEVGSLGYHSVNDVVTLVKSNDCVEGIAVDVQGKADPAPVTLMMWFDHELPEFCPVRHLLAWLGLSGIRQGYFFPDYNFLTNVILKDPSWNGDVTECISYNDVLCAWKNLCYSLLEREGKFGAHSGRKTGYLFGVWGGGQDADLMLSARHKSMECAMRYKRDAAFLLVLSMENNSELSQRTPKWRSLYCENHQLAMALNASSRPNFKPIHQLASIFVESKLVCPQQNLYHHSRVVGDKLLRYSHDYGCLDESRTELQRILAHLDPAVGNRIATLHARILEQRQAEIHAEFSQPLELLSVEEQTRENEVQPYKKRRGGQWDHPDRTSIGQLKDNMLRLEKIVEIYQLSVEEGIAPKMMTENCRTFFKEVAVPVSNCLCNHFCNDKFAFLERHNQKGKFIHCKFKKRCTGMGDNCGSSL